MDLRSTILGLLSWKPFSGYDLKRIISNSDVFYWSGNNNQIYKSLIALQKEGLVTHQIQFQESLPAKKIYTITDKGLTELRQSLMEDPEMPELRKGFLLQLAWAEILSDEEILILLGKYEDEITGQLRMRRAQAAKVGSSPDRSPREQYLWERISANIIAAYQAELDWARQTQQELRDRKYLKR
jgi:DNA-binding PadR family transcriptional regulator